MKLRGNVIELSSTGDGIRIVLQAPIGKASYAPLEKQIVIVADTVPNRRAFYMGRDVTIEIKPC